MGGALAVGVRHNMNGKPEEVIMDRWTNDFPCRFCTPSFLTQGDELKQFLAEAKPRNKWPKSKLLKEIEPSEYGLVLIDFLKGEVLSRNDYNETGTLIVTSHSTGFQKELTNLAELIRLGWIGKCLDIDYKEHDPEFVMEEMAKMIEEHNAYVTTLKGITDKKESLLSRWQFEADNKPDKGIFRFLNISLSDKVIKIDHEIDRHPTYEFVKKWCDDRNWQTPLKKWKMDEDE